MKPLVLVLTLAACTDAADEPICTPAPVTYRIDAVTLPSSTSSARDLGLDLNDDHTVDNQLGQVSGFLHGMFAEGSLPLDANAQAHLAGDTDWRIAVWQCEGDDRQLALTDGADPEPQFSGTAVDGLVVARGSGGTMPLGALFDGDGTAAPGFLIAETGAIELADVTGDDLTATIGLGLDGDLAAHSIVHTMTPFLNQFLVVGRQGIDTDHDGMLTEQELLHNAYVESLLSPDLAKIKATSFGVRVHATRVP